MGGVGGTWTLMALMPMAAACLRLSTSLDSMMISMPGSLWPYQAAATLIARSLRSLGLSPASCRMCVSLLPQGPFPHFTLPPASDRPAYTRAAAPRQHVSRSPSSARTRTGKEG